MMALGTEDDLHKLKNALARVSQKRKELGLLLAELANAVDDLKKHTDKANLNFPEV